MNVLLVLALLMILKTQANELFVTSIQEDNIGLTPCSDDADCENFINAKCIDEFCQCNQTKFCEDKEPTVIVTKLGETCKIRANCNIEHSLCKNNTCQCEEGKVGSTDNRKCLKVADHLEDTCEESVQCYTKIPNSDCQNDICVCQQHMHAYNGSCYRNVGLGELCKSIGDCSATVFARCVDEKCICKDGYVANPAAEKCLEKATKMDAPCYEHIQCSTSFGKAVCKEGHCKCEDGFQFKKSKSMCMKELLLHEMCMINTDCIPLDQGDSRLECILGTCKCGSEYNEELGECKNESFRYTVLPALILICGFILLIFFHDYDIVLFGTLAYSIFYMFWITILRRRWSNNNNYLWDQNPRQD